MPGEDRGDIVPVAALCVISGDHNEHARGTQIILPDWDHRLTACP
jgi:hypothetical protein